jgi:cyclase
VKRVLTVSTLLGLAAVSASVGWPRAVDAQRAGASAAARSPGDFWPVRGNVYMLVGAGGNITASVGRDGVLLVDTGTDGASDAVRGALARLEAHLSFSGALDVIPDHGRGADDPQFSMNIHSPIKPIRFVINTSARSEHVGGNAALAVGDAGQPAAALIAHENVLVRLVDAGAPFEMLPTETYAAQRYDLGDFFNGEAIRLAHISAASTDGDTIVYFRGSDVISSGDVFSMETFPVIDVEQGGSVNGVISALNYILSLAVTESGDEGGTTIVPGHGRLADATDVASYRDMVTIIRDQVQRLIDMGMTLEQVKAARPTLGYEGRFGSRSGTWTSEMFIDAVYQSLAERRQ